MKRLAASLLLLAACGQDGAESANASPEQIERLARAPEEKADPLASVRIEPLAPGDLEREGLLGAGCSFSRGDRMLLAAVGSNAIVRIGGETRHLVQSAAVGPSGGFFEDRQLSVSVGRLDEDGTAAGEATSWPARIRVTNRRSGVDLVQRGHWTCGA